MLVCVVVLGRSLGVVATDFRYKLKVEDEERKYHASSASVWQGHVKTFQKWKERLASTSTATAASTDGGGDASGSMSKAGGPPRSQAQVLLPSPVPLSDVMLDTAPAPAPPTSHDTDSSREELQRAQVELLLAMPALYHRQDPTQPPKIWNPFGELRPGFLPQYNEHLKKRGNADHRLVWFVPVLYVTAWVLDLVFYFGLQNAMK